MRRTQKKKCEELYCRQFKTVQQFNNKSYVCSTHKCRIDDCDDMIANYTSVYCSKHAKEYCRFKSYKNIDCNGKVSHPCIDLMIPNFKQGVCSECVGHICQYQDYDGNYCCIRSKDEFCGMHGHLVSKLICYVCKKIHKNCQDTHIHIGQCSRTVKMCTTCYHNGGQEVPNGELPPSYKRAMNETDTKIPIQTCV